jgi:hypothetical protein
MSMTNSTSSTATFGAQLVTLKSGIAPVTRRNLSKIIKFHQPPPRHRPLVLAWILPLGWPWRGRRPCGYKLS